MESISEMNNTGKVIEISISEKKGIPKNNVELAMLEDNFGIIGDAHAGSEKQVSLLSLESIKKMKEKGEKVKPGDFAENITTIGIDLSKLKISSKLKIGNFVVLEVTHKGKTCHNRCIIYQTVGECIMPKEGIFAKVIKGGVLKIGDKIEGIG